MLSLQAVWDDTAAFIKREQTLLFPLTLATIGLGNMAALLLQGAMKDAVSEQVGLGMSMAMLVAVLWVLVGQLAVIALALRGGCSVAEALHQGLNRLGRVLAVEILLGFALALLLAPALLPMLSHMHGPVIDPSQLHPTGPQALWIVAVFCAGLWFYARIVPIRALLVDQRISVMAALKTAFASTKGHAIKLLLMLLFYMIFALVIEKAAQFTLGSVFIIVGKMMDSPFTGKVLEAIVQSSLASAFGMVSAVFVAMLYKRLI